MTLLLRLFLHHTFDLVVELAKHYDVEVMEILDRERKDNGMDKQTEKIMLKVADYDNEERKFFISYI